MNSNRWRRFPIWCAFLLLVQFFSGCRTADALKNSSASRPPNIVLIFCDDMGYADIGPFGGKTPTPNLDRLAREGMRFTDFYVGQAVCSASRAALLTGRYPTRVGILGALGPGAKNGIRSEEVLIPEILKSRGYATAIFGKWHLGDTPEFLPTRHGFDEWFGLPYSNDMWPHHPVNPKLYPPLPLYDGEEVIEIMPDQTQLTTRYTERAVQFIGKNRGKPFFLYLAHNMPHVPLFVSEKFKGKSGRGLHGDVIMEIDWSVGEVLRALKENGLEKNTLVVFTSDNGPWLLYGNHAGSALPFREGKGTSFDGGVRVPCVMRWPGRISAGRSTAEPATTMDLLPTFAVLSGTNAPVDRVLDGRDISPLMFAVPGAKSPHEALFVHWGRELQAVRSGKWKLHFPHPYPTPRPPGGDGKPGKHVQQRIGLELFDLETDPGESRNVAAERPEVVAQLRQLAAQWRENGNVR